MCRRNKLLGMALLALGAGLLLACICGSGCIAVLLGIAALVGGFLFCKRC